MTLLEATSHLLDQVKTFGRDDAVTRRAIKRMEKRLEVLQLRADKEIKRRRGLAWGYFEAIYIHNHKSPNCKCCKFEVTFADFCKVAILTGRGHIKELRCPACSAPLIGFFDDDETAWSVRRLPPTSALIDQ